MSVVSVIINVKMHICKKSLKVPKGYKNKEYKESVCRRRTDSAMDKMERYKTRGSGEPVIAHLVITGRVNP